MLEISTSQFFVLGFCFLGGFFLFIVYFLFWGVVAYCTQLLSQAMHNLMMATTMAETCSCQLPSTIQLHNNNNIVVFDYFIHSLYTVIKTQRGCHTLQLNKRQTAVCSLYIRRQTRNFLHYIFFSSFPSGHCKFIPVTALRHNFLYILFAGVYIHICIGTSYQPTTNRPVTNQTLSLACLQPVMCTVYLTHKHAYLHTQHHKPVVN